MSVKRNARRLAAAVLVIAALGASVPATGLAGGGGGGPSPRIAK